MSMSTETDALTFLRGALSKSPSPDVSSLLTQIIQSYERKLWHPMATSLLALCHVQAARPLLAPLYERVVSGLEKKLDPLAVMDIAAMTAQTFTDPAPALSFLAALTQRLPSDPSVQAYGLSEQAHYQLVLSNLDEAKALMERSLALVDTSAPLDNRVHASQYRVSAAMDKLQGDYSAFYKHALLYLGVMPIDTLPVDQRAVWARDLAVAALLGDTIYNFGELLVHPVFEMLRHGSLAWLHQFVLAFNAGDMGQFEKLVQVHASDQIVSANLAFLKQKQCLMALVELVFQRGPTRRRVSFEDIASVTKLPLHEVEFLVMKALSLGLIRGKIDELDRVVLVTWVQSRVLDKTQIASMAQRVAEWQARVAQATRLVSNDTQDWLPVQN